MALRVNNVYTVTPAESTPDGPLSLTELDHNMSYASLIYLYRPSPDSLTQPDMMIETLRASLSQVLVYFYPMAGRLSWTSRGRLQLDCNSAGVQLIEAELDDDLDDAFLEDTSIPPPSGSLVACLIPSVDDRAPIHHVPLLYVQLTRFRCGAVAIGLSMSHVVTDGLGAFEFMGAWARVARNEPIGTLPVHDRGVLVTDAPITAHFEHPEFEPPPVLMGSSPETQRKRATTVEMLMVTAAQVEKLKKIANHDSKMSTHTCTSTTTARPYSRYEVLTGHIWRSMCMARGHMSEQPTALGVAVDCRSRLDPPPPKGYSGNAVVMVVEKGRSGELSEDSLGYAAGKVRGAIKRVSNEYVRSVMEFLRKQADLSQVRDMPTTTEAAEEGEEVGGERPFYGNPNAMVTSWLSLPIRGMDFGWGREMYVRPGAYSTDGGSLILPSPKGNGDVVIEVCLQQEHMDAFKTFFYQHIHIAQMP